MYMYIIILIQLYTELFYLVHVSVTKYIYLSFIEVGTSFHGHNKSIWKETAGRGQYCPLGFIKAHIDQYKRPLLLSYIIGLKMNMSQYEF